MVNHEEEFVNEDGKHTNNMEATWGAIKRKINSRVYTKDLVQSYIFEQMWRMKYKGAAWDGILYALKVVKYNKKIPNEQQELFNIF